MTQRPRVGMRLADITRGFRAVKDLFAGEPEADAKPLEIRAAVVDAVEGQVTPIGRGRRAFPFSRIHVRVLSRTTADRQPLAVTFAELEARIRERLREVRCDPPEPFEVKVSFLKKPPAGWTEGQLFAVEYPQGASPEPEEAAASLPALRVNVLKGTATRTVYAFRDALILIGRTPEVRDPSGRGRRNQVAFEDGNASVSRAHARLKFDPVRRRYHLLDDGSVHGTRVIRGGETIPVPKRDPRGVLVQSGDEIQLGEASVRVVIGS